MPRLLPVAFRESVAALYVLLVLGSARPQSLWAQNQNQQHTSIVTLTAESSGKPLQLSLGDVLIIRLPAAGGPGPAWRVMDLVPGMLALTSNTKLPGILSGVPGAPFTQELRFQTIGPGGQMLTLVSVAPGRSYSPIGDLFQTYVTVDQPGVAKNVSFSERGNRSQVTVNKGDQLTVQLETTVGSTFQWEAVPVSNGIVKLVKQQVGPDKPRKKVKVGAPEDVVFQYQALNSGQTTVKFLYRDTADNEAPPKRTFELAVTVP
ncbi:protease inhibitor I42 family protein [Hymenobacter jejuensis]|nr:protease inhibitor I42 family protein [Hymenobacter jejuensis]